MKMTTFEQHAHDLTPAMKMMRDNDTLALCARIQAAAIKCDDYHVFVSYAPHVSGFTVYVGRTGIDYQNPEHVLDKLIGEVVYIDRPDSLEELTALVDQLQRLGVEV